MSVQVILQSLVDDPSKVVMATVLRGLRPADPYEKFTTEINGKEDTPEMAHCLVLRGLLRCGERVLVLTLVSRCWLNEVSDLETGGGRSPGKALGISIGSLVLDCYSIVGEV